MPLLATKGSASAQGFSFISSSGSVIGQQAYTSDGTYSWVCPAGVTSISVVCVSSGAPIEQNSNRRGDAYGGCLSYKNNISVVPGTSYTVRIYKGSWSIDNPISYFNNSSTVSASGYNTRVGDGGGNGGSGNTDSGKGAGGYSGNGGTNTGPAQSGSGGGGGAGGFYLFNATVCGAGGGGVGLLGQGSNGAGGNGFPYPTTATTATGGGGGSGGSNGQNVGPGDFQYGNGGDYGGGAGLWYDGLTGTKKFADSGGGAVRIIWPGNSRAFPSTNTGNL